MAETIFVDIGGSGPDEDCQAVEGGIDEYGVHRVLLEDTLNSLSSRPGRFRFEVG